MAETVLSSPDILETHILPRLPLTKREAARLKCISHFFCELLNCPRRLEPRVLIALGSKSAVLDVTGIFKPSWEWHKGLPTCRLGPIIQNHWLTSMASDGRGSVFCLMYRGSKTGRVIEFTGNFDTPGNKTNKVQGRVAHESTEIRAPEGIAFFNDAMFVLTADALLVQLAKQSDGSSWQPICSVELILDDMVPWGLKLGPDNALYAACDKSYQNKAYTVPPTRTTGHVQRIPLRPALTPHAPMLHGDPESASIFTATPIKRPSGLCFGPCGSLFVTSLDGCVHCFEGPQHPSPGTLRLTIPLEPSGLLPWDVVAFTGPQGKGTDLIVSVHRQKDGKSAQRARKMRMKYEELREGVGVVYHGMSAAAADDLACHLCLVQDIRVLEGAVRGSTQRRRLPASVEHANMFCLE